MNAITTESPKLVEPGVKYFLGNTLDNCSKFKKRYYNDLFNWLIAGTIISIICGFLYYKYKGKLTPSQKIIKEREKQHYILSRIQTYQDNKRRASYANITGMPAWENEYDNV